jgi:hypothetical protein
MENDSKRGPNTSKRQTMMDPGGPTNSKSATVLASSLVFDLSYRDLFHDQGVCLTVKTIGKTEPQRELLRFDCFDEDPHYHYDPENKNETHQLDKTTAGNPIGWVLEQLRTNLRGMLLTANAGPITESLNLPEIRDKLTEVEEIARNMARMQRSTVRHNRGDRIIEAGNIRFGLEYRNLGNDEGMAVHVLGDVSGEEIELLAFDCFRNAPHYHYGPRNKNIRLYWDKTAVPDTLKWTLQQFREGKLANMLTRAGYPGIVSELDHRLIQAKLPEVETHAFEMEKAK